MKLKLFPKWQWQDVRGQLSVFFAQHWTFSEKDNNIIFLQTSNHVKWDFSLTRLWNVRHGKGLLGIVTAVCLLWWAMLWDWFFEHHHLWWQHWFCEVAVIILIYRGPTQLRSLFKVLEIVSSRERIPHPAVSVIVFLTISWTLWSSVLGLKNKLL